MVILVGSLCLPWSAEKEEESKEAKIEPAEAENDMRKVPLIIDPDHVDEHRVTSPSNSNLNVPFEFAANHQSRKKSITQPLSNPGKSIVDARKAISSKEPVAVNTVLGLGSVKRNRVPEMFESSLTPSSSQKAVIPDNQAHFTNLNLENLTCPFPPALHLVASSPALVPKADNLSQSIQGIDARVGADPENVGKEDHIAASPKEVTMSRSRSFSRARSGSSSRLRSNWTQPTSFSHVILGRSFSYKSLRSIFGLSNGNITQNESNFNWQIVPQHGGNGGLYNAFTKAIKEGQIKGLKWVGLLGTPTDLMSKDAKVLLNEQLAERDCVGIYVTDSQWEGHYTNYCKEFLWPTFHAQVPDIPQSRSYEESSWGDYTAVNRAIAEGLVASYKEGDTIIVNDYHLMLVPAMIREKLPNAIIGFFMHISFPTSESFRCLAYRNELLKGMLAADLIGFQNNEYAHHFLMTVARVLAFDSVHNYIQTHDREVHVISCPIGIDSDRLDQILKSDAVKSQRERIRARWPTAQIFGSRDKVDSVRGLRHKLHAFHMFLKQYPKLASKVVLIQVLLSAVADSDLEAELASIADDINSTFGDVAAGIQPVVLLRQDIVFEQYIALLAEADAFVVTSLRDGMNLTCHEFIHCNEKNGPVILSEFTGSAIVLGDDALLINPWDVKRLAEVFYEATLMNPLERKRRSDRLWAIVAGHTSEAWVEYLVSETKMAWSLNQQRSSRKPDFVAVQQLYHKHKNERRLILIEIPSVRKPFEPSAEELPTKRNPMRRTTSQLFIDDSKLPNYAERLLFVLRGLLNDPLNIVYISGSESRLYMERIFRNLPSVGLIAEAGQYLRLPDRRTWIDASSTIKHSSTWKDELQPMLQSMALRLPVQNISIHESTIIIDFEKQPDIDDDRKIARIGEYVGVIEDAFSKFGVRSYFDNGNQLTIFSSMVLEMKAWALKTLTQLYPDQFGLVLAACQPLTVEADDFTFKKLENWTRDGYTKDLITILLGPNHTRAQYNSEGLNSLLSLLEAVSKTC